VRTALAVAKMSGAGNDFLVFDGREIPVFYDRPEWIRRVCRRGLSAGADGVLFVAPAGAGRVRVLFRNPDGSPAFCGNGSRCAARFAHARGMCGSTTILETEAGEVEAEIRDSSVRLRLPPPVDRGERELSAIGEKFRGRFILSGVPHLVLPVACVDAAPLEIWGPALRSHAELGPGGTNVDLISRLAEDRLAVRTWERGVEGETLACGSAAVAAAFCSRLAGGAVEQEIVPASGVVLQVGLPGPASSPEAAILTGEARFIFEGQLHPEAEWGASP